MNEPALIANALEAEAQQEAAHGMEAGPSKRRIDAQCRKHVPPALAEYAFEKMVERDAIGEVIAEDMARERVQTVAPITTTSDQYRAELYDEMWAKARSMGFGNIIGALTELERMKASAAPAHEAVVWARQCDLDEADPAIFVAREEVRESGYTVPLYANSDAGEVERRRDNLRAWMATAATRLEHWKTACAEADKSLAECRDLRAQLAERDALLRDAVDDLEDWRRSFPDANSSVADGIIERADALLSASAEPAEACAHSEHVRPSDRVCV